MEHKINPLEEPPVYEVASGLPSYDEIIGVKTIANVESNATVNSTAEPKICANRNTGTSGVSSNKTNDFVIHINSMQNRTENISISNHGYHLNDVFCRTEYERNNEFCNLADVKSSSIDFHQINLFCRKMFFMLLTIFLCSLIPISIILFAFNLWIDD
ncbi:hypothetical protein EDEG_03882 [Edhazardia aedis USNM 41457]|uniref:Uncharacterized protein n=1 Tax=Edhazardia aedis (strain USNM 41457) TaxID=1003232 RepID=J9D1W0_EDHAE|nr:hypothetical protein EDEG_03882 [Edhazardia aedis USNM 41457]|eukprot:EJW01549.1 hypothetical protein EDEG_03882 [Edhazardia aedis USNM 41457]